MADLPAFNPDAPSEAIKALPAFNPDAPAEPIKTKETGVINQFGAGFNKALAPYFELPERGLRAVSQLAQGNLPSMANTEPQLSEALADYGSPAPPQGALQRFANRSGQTVGGSLPYAAASFGAAPIVDAAVQQVGPEAGALTRAVGHVARGIIDNPTAAANSELIGTGVSGAGAGAIAAVAPGHPTAEAYAELLSPVGALAAAKSINKGVNLWGSMFSEKASQKSATDAMSTALARDIGPEEIAGIDRAQQLQSQMPGSKFSLAESTGQPDLVATQKDIESKMGAGDRSARRDQYRANVDAINAFADSHAPEVAQPGQGPQMVVDVVSGRVQDLTGKLDAQVAATGDKARGLVASLPATDQYTAGNTIRDRELSLRQGAREEMKALADEKGINNVQLPAPVDGLQSKLSDLVRKEGGDFEDAANRPKVINDILQFGSKESPAEWSNYDPEVQSQLRSGELKLVKDPATGTQKFVPGVATPDAGGTTVDSLFKLQSRISDDMRDASSGTNYSAKKVRMLAQVGELVDQHVADAIDAVADPALKASLADFRQQYKANYIDRFNQGVAYKVRANDGNGFYQTQPERVAQAFWGTPSGAKQFKTTFRGDPEATAALGDSALDDLRTKTVRDGVVNDKLLETWLRQNNKSLAEFPDIKSRVDTVADASAALAQRNAQLAGRRTVIEDSALATQLAKVDAKESPEILAQNALKSPRLMTQVLHTLNGNAEATASWNRTLWDHAVHSSPEDMEALLNNPQMKRALGAQHIDALKDIFDAAKMTGAVGPPGGASIIQDPYNPFRVHAGTGIDSFMAKLWAVESGRTSAKWLGLNQLGNTFRAQYRNALTRTMKRALYDPTVAINLAQSMKDRSPISPSAGRVRSYLFNAGLDLSGVGGKEDFDDQRQ